MEFYIKSAKIKSSIFLAWSYEKHEPGKVTNIKADSNAPIHQDLIDAFQSFIPHFVLLSEMKKKPDVVKMIDLDSEISEDLKRLFKIESVSVVDSNGEMAVTISGRKHLQNGKSITFSTPSTDRGSKDNEYEFYDKMIERVENLQEEVMQYMEGKHGEIAQKTIGFEDDQDGDKDDASGFNPNADTKESDDGDFQVTNEAKKAVKNLKKALKDTDVTMTISGGKNKVEVA